MGIANLPMYDLPELQAITDQWWSGLARAFRAEGISDVPDALWRKGDHRVPWMDPDLILSQTCGYPLMNGLRGKVSLVATPCYGAAECEGPDYCSIVVVHEDNPAQDIREFRGKRCVINSWDSQSGCNALRALIAPLAQGKPFFREVKVSGGHRNSATMVANGEADVAALDCVTFALLSRHCPQALAGTRMLTLTPRAPGLPYITRRSEDSDFLSRLRSGLTAACQDPTLTECREALMICGFSILALSDYACIVETETAAFKSGYTELSR
jgi:ABC-type phosphate/phosphonate transport system substrate-binding protein